MVWTMISICRPPISAYAYRQTARKEDALDLTQEIMIAALRSLKTFNAGKASFRTWLYRVASHKIVDWRRRQRPETLPLEEVELPAEDRSLEAVGDRLLLRQIERHIASLEPETQSDHAAVSHGGPDFVGRREHSGTGSQVRQSPLMVRRIHGKRGEAPHLPRGLPAERSLLRRRSASLTDRGHIPPRVFKETAHLSREFDAIQKTMAQITPFNSKARTAEVRKRLERRIKAAIPKNTADRT